VLELPACPPLGLFLLKKVSRLAVLPLSVPVERKRWKADLKGVG